MAADLPAVTLQPSNATPLRRAVSLVNAERRPVDMTVLATIMDPWKCPADLLPWLAWGFSVDIWNERWPELKKRWVIANSIRLHRIKTTPAGIREHVALTGAEVRKIIRPPARAYLRPAMTEAARLAWLDSLPQIRIRPFALRQTANGRWFWNGHCERSFYGAAFYRASRGRSIYGRSASFYSNGIEVPAHLEEVALPGQSPFDRIHLTAAASPARRFWMCGSWRRMTLRRSTADSRVLTVRLDDTGMLTTLTSNLQPVDIRPQRIAERYIAAHAKAFFGNRAFFRRFWTRCNAALHLYDRISLLSGPYAFAGGRAVSFWGRCRFGIRPFTSEITIATPMRRCQRAKSRYWTGHWKRADMTPLYDAIAAVTVSKAFRDRVLINPTTHRVIQLSDLPRLGEFGLGELKRTA